ncbi:deoxyguanosinetriphosphate triphosphohydrolase [Dissulfurirhabdus thermomarina]|uniref:Deoxyguanosinetriphosphate triphosphohydrolase-like protein n=1 Tax=Dissulfurirhabdus thermomarina TaxID=1765737 RepID=A0A6N9TRR5_DISTH|nr:deoxyguanosinetriphosphate triphosphohydrolase [Dissulfurirhabdus thermomarina]NDY42444.1 deoxyguanosinetriphosphate triphosphohydrolase [Dissulfurirhabdus thermomarina]NMX23380.1 deoxyguanosinetriphosphate triphosphohydrolase [Dissulfurirhabdus thermomarina]
MLRRAAPAPAETSPAPATIREEIEARERQVLCPQACLSSATRGRRRPVAPCPIRTAFQRDRDRIVYSKAFRRLKHKTQVFLSPMGDHYRTRLTHTLEVSEIARTIARALRLNEDLTEAIAMGHDLGHTPFGHAGETVLNEIVPGGFSHCQQSLRVVDLLENEGRGLNLTYEVRDGILKHSKGFGEIIPQNLEEWAATQEGRVMRLADVIAYLSHDLDDAIRSGVISAGDVPGHLTDLLGEGHSARITTMIRDVIENTRVEDGEMHLGVSPEMYEAMLELRKFLYDNVYRAARVHGEFEKARKILRDLFEYFLDHPEAFRRENRRLFEGDMDELSESEPYERRVCDFLAGMTDRYAQNLYEKIFIPSPLV